MLLQPPPLSRNQTPGATSWKTPGWAKAFATSNSCTAEQTAVNPQLFMSFGLRFVGRLAHELDADVVRVANEPNPAANGRGERAVLLFQSPLRKRRIRPL